MADILIEKLTFLVKDVLKINAPVMSGNMKNTIEIIDYNENQAVICINAPTYDVPLWKKTKQIRYTHKGSYATSVNEYGGFKSMNKSRHWVNRAVYNACKVIADQNKGEVKCYVELQ